MKKENFIFMKRLFFDTEDILTDFTVLNIGETGGINYQTYQVYKNLSLTQVNWRLNQKIKLNLILVNNYMTSEQLQIKSNLGVWMPFFIWCF